MIVEWAKESGRWGPWSSNHGCNPRNFRIRVLGIVPRFSRTPSDLPSVCSDCRTVKASINILSSPRGGWEMWQVVCVGDREKQKICWATRYFGDCFLAIRGSLAQRRRLGKVHFMNRRLVDTRARPRTRAFRGIKADTLPTNTTAELIFNFCDTRYHVDCFGKLALALACRRRVSDQSSQHGHRKIFRRGRSRVPAHHDRRHIRVSHWEKKKHTICKLFSIYPTNNVNTIPIIDIL